LVLALGGGSWPQLGSDAAWMPLLAERDVAIAALKPANCGFEVLWSPYFRERFAGHPLKAVALSIKGPHSVIQQHGELVITDYGLEGSLIYQFSALLRELITEQGSVAIELDLIPNLELPAVHSRINSPRGKNSLSNHLRKRLNLDALKFALAHEVLPAASIQNADILAATLKALPIKLQASRPIAEAISTAGGVKFSAMDENLMLKAMPGVFCAGEMLDWEAPTGGYLLSACLATGRAAGHGLLNWLKHSHQSSVFT
jgi:uncharacterized flavoprotein (TIGR03862 family)